MARSNTPEKIRKLKPKDLVYIGRELAAMSDFEAEADIELSPSAHAKLPLNRETSPQTPKLPVYDVAYFRERQKNTRASEKIGQNFLADPVYQDIFTGLILPGAEVIEVGTGPGNLTAKIAKNATKVTGIEIDQRFGPELDIVTQVFPQVTIKFADINRVKLNNLITADHRTQIVGNIPFHVTEPLIKQIASISEIENCVFILGRKAVEEITAPLGSTIYGRLSFLTQSLFSIEVATTIPSAAFFPEPNTDAAILILTPKEVLQDSDRFSIISGKIAQASLKGGSVKTVLESAFNTNSDSGKFLTGQDRRQRDRGRARRELKEWLDNYQDSTPASKSIRKTSSINLLHSLGLPESTLQKPFQFITNQELVAMLIALKQNLSTDK